MQLFKKKRDAKLLKAVANDDSEALDKLLKAYTPDQLNQRFSDDRLLMEIAVENNASKALKRIIVAGVTYPDHQPEHLLVRSLEQPQRLSLLKSLIEAGADISRHKQILVGKGQACCSDNDFMLFLTMLCQQGIDIDTPSEDGVTSMDFALRKQDLALINFLIGSGAKERDNWPAETSEEIISHIKRRYEDLKIQAAFLQR